MRSAAFAARRPPQRAERLTQPEEHDDAGGRPSDEESDRLVELVPNDEVDDVEPMEPEAARRDIIGTVRRLREDGDAPLAGLGAVGRAKMQITRADALRVDEQPMEPGTRARRQLHRIRGHGGIDEIGILGDPALQALRRSQASDASTGRLERVEDELVDVMKRIILEHCILRAVSLRQGREISDDGPGKECADELREDEIDDQPRRERLHLLHRSVSTLTEASRRSCSRRRASCGSRRPRARRRDARAAARPVSSTPEAEFLRRRCRSRRSARLA